MPTQSDQEFRRYRLTVGAVAFGLTVVAIAWLAGSVGAALIVPPPPAADGPRFSGRADDLDALSSCERDLRSLLDALAAPPGTPPEGGWQALDEGWRARWGAVGARCRFEELRDRGLGSAFDHLAWVHAELRGVHASYADLLSTYLAREQTRVEDLRHALETSRRTIERERARRPAPPG